MIDSSEIHLRNPRTHGHDKVIRQLIESGSPEPIARNQVAQAIKEIRSNPISKEILREKGRVLKDAQAKSLIDPLTQLYNRRYLDGDGSETASGVGELQREFDRALRLKHDLSLLLIDIDNFKEYNDRHSHLEGDVALKTISDVVKATSAGLPIRFGGEELLILLPETNLDSATEEAEKLRQIIEEIKILKGGQVTISVGVSTFHNSEEWRGRRFNQVVETKDELLKLADDALYFSKKNGRNKVTTGNNLTDEQILEIHPKTTNGF